MQSGHLCDYLKHGASVHLVPEELGNNPRQSAHFTARRELTVWYSTPTIRAVPYYHALIRSFQPVEQA